MDEHISSCIAVYITVIDMIHNLRAENFLKTSNVLFCYGRGEGALVRVLRLDNAWAIMVHNKYIHMGVFWTSADPDPPPWRLSCPPLWLPQLYGARTATGYT